MKKLLCILFVAICLVGVVGREKTFLQVIKMPKDSVYSLYINQQVVPTMAGVDNVQNGTLSILSCNSAMAKNLYKTCNKEILGQQIKFECDNEEFFNYLKSLDCKIVFSESIGNIQSFYCYNDYLDNTISLPYGKVNLQVAFSEGQVTVGNPIIIGSY